MKYAKRFGLAVLAVAALMSVVAASASAEKGARICSTEGLGESCGGQHGKHYTGPIHAVLPAGGSAVLTATNAGGGSVATVTCTESTVQGNVSDATNGTGSITALTFAKCSSPACPGGVTASTSNFPWHVTATTTTPGVIDTNGILHVTGARGKFVCGSIIGNITCEYSAATATVHVTGSDTTPIVHANSVPLTRLAGPEAICGAKADWSATYHVTTPKSLFIL
jgi:hypothetical protein